MLEPMQVTIDGDTWSQYQRYAATRKEDVSQSIAYALRDWMESVGEGRIEDSEVR